MSGTTALKKAAEYERDNRAAARLILREPERYGGEGGLMVNWARKVLNSVIPARAKGQQGTLFDVRQEAA